MESIEFIRNYKYYLEEISNVAKPELQSITKELEEIDPHDLIKPDTYFSSEAHARGYVWSMFLKMASKLNLSESDSK